MDTFRQCEILKKQIKYNLKSVDELTFAITSIHHLDPDFHVDAILDVNNKLRYLHTEILNKKMKLPHIQEKIRRVRIRA